MAIRRYVNTATQAATTAAIAATDTSITVSNYAGYPSAVPFTVALARGTANEEIVLVTAVASNVLTVTRGYDGTTAKAQTAGTTVLHVVAAIDFTEANAHVNATSAVHGVTGDVVGTSGAQTITGKTFTGAVNQATASADAVVASIPSGVTKNAFVGSNNGVTTFSVSQTGVVNASGQVNANAGLAVTGNATVSLAFTVTGALTAGSLSTAGNLSVTGTATVTGGLTSSALLTASAGIRVVSAGIRHVPISAPAGTAGEVTEWVQSDGGFYFRNGTGAIARSGTYWGSGTTFPTAALVGDTYSRSDVGAGCLFELASGGWRQLEVPSMTTAQRTSIPAVVLYRGLQVHDTTLGYVMEWQTTTTGWTLPWDTPWGVVSGAISATSGWTPPNIDTTGRATYRTDFIAHPKRRYRYKTQTIAYMQGATGRAALYSYAQFTTVANQGTAIGSSGNAMGHLYGGVSDDWVNVGDEWVYTGESFVGTPTPVSYRWVAYLSGGTGFITAIAETNVLMHYVEDLGPIGAAT